MTLTKVEEEAFRSIGDILCDPERPLKERFRALFTLRNLKGKCAVENIEKAFSDTSALLKHECAYCLGQMQDISAVPILSNVLRDVTEDPMVRHEAGEALGAIGSKESVEVLKKYADDTEAVISETCQIALERIQWLIDEGSTNDKNQSNPYIGIDPTPSTVETDDRNTLEKIFLDENKSLYERYKAMFALRNLGDINSVLSLCKGLRTGSALYRHEVAFVLGQLQHEASVPSLIESLENVVEHEMVRHECAEALGSIANTDSINALKKFLNDSSRVVRESCVVALDMCDYENTNEFQYADSLIKTRQNDENHT